MIALEIILTIALCCQQLWTYASVTVRLCSYFHKKVPLANTLHIELKPFYLPATTTNFLCGSILHGLDGIGWRIFAFLSALLVYWFYRHTDDDDRWKRRKERLREKVSVSDGKLVVVPTN